ncbi:MAG: SDR family NAD(P)-dependent oxidoreductase [Dehalococcoidia bacterium]
MRLDGQVIIVTGGGSGIGRATSRRLASEGARVAIADVNAAGADETAALVRGDGSPVPLCIRTDVTDLAAVQAMARGVLEWGGRIDGLVNNAGWDQIELFIQSEPETWDKVIGVNLRGPINCTHAVLPAMIGQRAGRIVNISSDAGRVGSSGEAVYSACKAGVIGFSKTIAREVARYAINVNVVCPGVTDTPLLEQATGGADGQRIIESMVRQVPFRRLGQPEEIAAAVAFFLSPDAVFCTGQVLSVSGGLTMAG